MDARQVGLNATLAWWAQVAATHAVLAGSEGTDAEQRLTASVLASDACEVVRAVQAQMPNGVTP